MYQVLSHMDQHHGFLGTTLPKKLISFFRRLLEWWSDGGSSGENYFKDLI